MLSSAFISMLFFTSSLAANAQPNRIVSQELELVSEDRTMYCADMQEIITDLMEYTSNSKSETFDTAQIKHEIQDITSKWDNMGMKLHDIIDELVGTNNGNEPVPRYHGLPPSELNDMHYHNEHSSLQQTTTTEGNLLVDSEDSQDNRRRLIGAFNWAFLKTKYNGYCVDQRVDDGKTVYGRSCLGVNNQRWSYNIHTQQIVNGDSNKCLDFNFGDGDDVYTHSCHSGNNQKWYFDGDKIRTRWNGECLDYNPDSQNMHCASCHGRSNQLFYN